MLPYSPPGYAVCLCDKSSAMFIFHSKLGRRLHRAGAHTSGKVKRISNSRYLFGFLHTLALLVLFSNASFLQAQQKSLEDSLSQARELEKSENYAGAERVYQAALSEFPNHPEILKRLGVVYQTELKFPESIETFQKALQVDPQYPEVNFYLGLSYFGLNQYENSLKSFENELKFHPDYHRAHYYAAKVLLALGRKGEAIQHLETLVKENPDDEKVWFELAGLYRSLAVHAYNEIARVDPNSVLLHALRGESNAEDHMYPEALKEYQEVLEQQPDFPGVHFALGEINFNQHKYDDAEKNLRDRKSVV